MSSLPGGGSACVDVITENVRPGVCHTVPGQSTVITALLTLWRTYVNVIAATRVIRPLELTVIPNSSLQWISCMGE